ncbi:MAG: ATP-binding protein [Muribaculaceae bacterium]|nr:ATP-binding protein [Muribaculaceae bacterium]
MKDIRAVRGRRYILDLIAEGEHEQQDFKYSITDACKIARSISAFANHSGGRLLIGVKDNGTVAGVRNEEDIYVVEQAATLYCRPEQHVEFDAFRVDASAVVIRATIAPSAVRPVQARDSDGRWTAFYRVADENIHAHPLMVTAWRMAGSESAEGSLVVGTDGHEMRLMQLIAAEGEAGLNPDDAAPALGLSRATTAALITRLAVAGLLSFRYAAPSFRLVLAEPGI